MVYPVQSRRGFPWRRVVFLLIVIAVLFVAYRLLFGGSAEEQQAQTPPPPAVTVQDITVRDIPLVFEYPARLAGSREVEIRARVGGILLKRAYEEGRYVQRGDLLFQIDPAPYKAALAQARASFTQSERDYSRAVTLQKQKALSAREFDEAQAVYGSAKAQVETAEINLAYTTVRAPISGFTSEEEVSEGSLVAADQTLLTRLTQLDPIYVEFAYPDSEAMLQRQGVAQGQITLPRDKMLTAEILFKDGSSYDTEGKIRFTDSIISAETGSVRARAILPNKAQAIMPGQFVQVRVKGMTQVDAIGIPEKAIMQGPMGTFVYTVTPEGKAAIAVVKLGLLNQGTQMVTEGLKDGDRVIVDGMIKVRPDQPVCIDTGKPDSPCNPANAAKPAEGEGKAPAAPAAEAKKDADAPDAEPAKKD